MRFPLRCPVDDRVDRPDVEAQQCVELTGTNTPITHPNTPFQKGVWPPRFGGVVAGRVTRVKYFNKLFFASHELRSSLLGGCGVVCVVFASTDEKF